jgi:GNAT superfamily N-acetyltransferase
MKDALIIEKISKENFNDFVFLLEKLATYEKFESPDEQAKKRLKRDGLSKNPKYEAYLGYVRGKAVGYIVFFINYSSFLALPTLYLEDIFVLEEHRKKGYGRKLFEFCVKIAQERNCGRMEWCVLTWNDTAIKFYEKIGGTRLDWYFYRLKREQILEM